MDAQGSAKIKITVGSDSFVLTTYDNATARAFVEMLPMTVSMNGLNGNEKYYYISQNLPSSPERPSTIYAGDLMLYGSNCLVLFYETFTTSYSYTRIGQIENPSGLKMSLGSNNANVTFEVFDNINSVVDINKDNLHELILNDGILRYNGDADNIFLIDLNGRTLARTATNTLNVQAFPKGFYILRIKEKNKNI
ncbi:MAG: cyclophilin-like fold protein [Selenomonadaceae bacterium]